MDQAHLISDDSINERSEGPACVSAAARRHDPPTIDSEELALTNRLCHRRHPTTVTLGDVVLGFTPISLDRIGPTAPSIRQRQLDFTVDGRTLVLRMAGGLFDHILARIDPGLLVTNIDHEIMPLLLEACLEQTLTDAEATLNRCITLAAVQDSNPIDRDGLDYRVTLAFSVDGKDAGEVTLDAAADDIEHLAKLADTRPRAPRAYDDLKIALSFRTRAIDLTLAELRALKIGDVILTEADAASWDQIAAVIDEHSLFPIDRTDKGPTVTGRFRQADQQDQEEWMMVDMPPDEQQPTTPATDQPEASTANNAPQVDSAKVNAVPAAHVAQDALGMKLVFELGRLEIPLGQLQDIGPGHVFALDRPLGEAVDIHAGGRRIGQGEVMRIEDQVGVRIRRLFDQTGA